MSLHPPIPLSLPAMSMLPTRVIAFLTLVLGAALAPGRARAQALAHTGTVDGVVYDSVRKQPLAHAIVQLVEAPPGNGAYSASTDSLGRFRIADVRAGQYIAGILHPLLDSIGVLAPYRSVKVTDNGSARVELAIPSALGLTNAICAPARAARMGKASADSTGTLVGHVYDAATGAPMPSTLIAALWTVLSLDGHGVHRETQQLHARTNEDGWFAFCGLGAGDYQLRAENGARNTGFIDFTLLPHDIARMALILGADSAASTADTAARGSARLAGTVTTKDGHPIEGAQVVVDGSPASATTDPHGAFSLGGLLDGTRMVEARALGYAPVRVPVTPSRNELTSIAIVMDKRVETLQTVTVFGKESARMRDLTGFAERSRRGFGRFVTRSQIEMAGPQTLCDLFRRVPGVTVTDGGGGMGCELIIRGMASMSRCQPTVYLDNTKFGGSVSELANSISPSDIMGIELYSSATEPVQFPGGCGSIVVWTR
jgi:Carboxypeptidase regulatory-like domain/TonB-dependent Receptor Plug Domain